MTTSRCYRFICYLRRSALLVVLALTGACSTTVTVDTDFPDPVVSKLPLKMGVFYSDKLKNYTHIGREATRGNREWTLNIGQAQVNLFDTILAGMFNELRPVADPPPLPEQSDLDAVIVPSIRKLEFSVPEETEINVYEIWIQYRLRLISPGGDPILEWPMTAYGKTSSLFFQTANEALEDAVAAALRDAGTVLAIQLPKVQAIRQWHASSQVGGARASGGGQP